MIISWKHNQLYRQCRSDRQFKLKKQKKAIYNRRITKKQIDNSTQVLDLNKRPLSYLLFKMKIADFLG
jgi:hypothetical protein